MKKIRTSAACFSHSLIQRQALQAAKHVDLPNISFLRRLLSSSSHTAAMSATKTKVQEIIDNNGVGRSNQSLI